MRICHEHNLSGKSAGTAQPGKFGIRVKLRSTDPFRKLVGGDWSKEHWFDTPTERDAALIDMSTRYPYFRPGDAPALVFEKIG